MAEKVALFDLNRYLKEFPFRPLNDMVMLLFCLFEFEIFANANSSSFSNFFKN